MSNELKSIDEHNAARRASLATPAKTGNGIACPKCKSELQDTNPGMILASSPPQKDVRCPACGFTGLRLA